MSTPFHNNLWPNAVHVTTIPPYLLTKANYGAMRIWDNFWRPVMQKYLPADTSEGGLQTFSRDIAIDSAPIAPMVEQEAKTEFVTEGFKKEDFHTRRTAKGYYLSPEEMVWGIQGKAARMTELIARAISRRIEYEAVKYVSGEAATINQFSNQGTGRMLTAPLNATTNSFTGKRWDEASSHPFVDLDNAQELEDLGGDRSFQTMIMGPKTFKILKNHADVLDRIKYVKNLVDGSVIEATFDSIALDVVRGQTYKEPPGMTGLPDSPGLGDLQEFTWAEINKKRFMFHQSGGNDYEYALLLTENAIGNIVFSRNHPDDKQWAKAQPFQRYWKENDPEYHFWAFSKNFAPFVEDFLNIMRLNFTVLIGAS
jgi:hypothetical protein